MKDVENFKKECNLRAGKEKNTYYHGLKQFRNKKKVNSFKAQ